MLLAKVSNVICPLSSHYGPHSPIDSVVVFSDELIYFGYNFDSSNEVEVVVDSGPMLSIGEVIIETLSGDGRNSLSHQNLAHSLV